MLLSALGTEENRKRAIESYLLRDQGNLPGDLRYLVPLLFAKLN
jgi:hypothetical protein